ncbi:MAG: hypothetical protein KC635_21915, partial [Myxococcales bacterium]|nr:hypothetical protein [Myxococcales bacterium]
TESWGLNALWFEDACPGPGAAPGLLQQSVMANASDTPKEALLAVGTFFGGQDAFDLDFESSAIDPGATCANASRLGVGDAVVAKVDGGPPGPAVCWCSSPDRVAFVDVEVPAGKAVDVRGVIANDDANAQLQIVELASACADECGTNAAFGGSTFPATLRLDNAGETRETHHLIVLSQAGWDAEDPAAPPVRVEVVEAN